MMFSLAWLIPTFTAAAFALIVLVTRDRARLSAYIGVAGIGLSLIVALGVLVTALGVGGEHLAEQPSVFEFDWAPAGGSYIRFGWLIDPLSVATLAMVTVVCTLIFVYSTEYMAGECTAYKDPATGEMDPGKGEARYARFFAYVSLFATGMLGFVLSSNLLQALVFWEIMGLCSYLLIGFWYYKPSASAAARKAFMTTRVGDVMFLLGIAGLFSVFGNVDYASMLSGEGVEKLRTTVVTFHREAVVIAPPLPGFPSISLPEASMALPVATVLMLLVFGGAVGKSAQFPLHVWLPDAMEGPTPVSALIHAATMVAAGVYLVARTFPLFASAAHEGISPAMLVVALIGAVTALMAATIGLAQFDIKRVLAYSTISQLGYMIMALGIGAYVAAVFHLITHAFFKALLFLGSGSVIHGLEHGLQHAGGHASAEAAQAQGPLPGAADPRDPNDMRNMGGLRQRMPITFWTFLAGSLALTGIPVFAGFWSKDEILAEAFHKGLEGGLPIAALVWLFGTVAAFFTATYMARQVFMVFGGPAQTEAAAHAPESRPAMTAPLVILAVFAVVLGLVGVPATFPGLGAMLGNPFHRFVGTFSFSGLHTEALEFNIVPAAISVAAAAGGWGAGWLIYGRRPAQARQRDPLRALGLLWTLLNRKYFMDELYGLLVVRASVAFAAANAFVDQKLVDGAVNATGFGGELFSRVNGWIDTHIVDGIVNLVAVVTREMARAVRVIQTGQVQNYLLLVFFGLMFLVGAVLTR